MKRSESFGIYRSKTLASPVLTIIAKLEGVFQK
jgi:hypothetical protein